MEDPNEFLEEIQESLKNSDMAGAAGLVQAHLKKQDEIPLNIAVTGETGAGKSTFVNAIRGIDNKDPSAAPTGAVETTMEPTAYPHPSYSNVTVWDLPGIGTTKFPAAEYMKEMKVETYDFFIIISCDRFKENDANLARELQKLEKKFYFVRSKIDHVLQNEKRCQRDFNACQTLQLIRDDCIQGLQELGVTSPQVFLLSSFELHLHDFIDLTETLEKELPSQKKNDFLFALPCTHMKVIEKKKQAFRANIKYLALLSLGVAAIPIPGLSIAADVAILVKEVINYKLGFGLDERSLQKLALVVGQDIKDLKSVMTSPLAVDVINADVIFKLFTHSATYATLATVEENARFIPIIGTVTAMAISFGTIYALLEACLDMISDDAHNVLKKAMGLYTPV